jgi:hypothetical protein
LFQTCSHLFVLLSFISKTFIAKKDSGFNSLRGFVLFAFRPFRQSGFAYSIWTKPTDFYDVKEFGGLILWLFLVACIHGGYCSGNSRLYNMVR